MRIDFSQVEHGDTVVDTKDVAVGEIDFIYKQDHTNLTQFVVRVSKGETIVYDPVVVRVVPTGLNDNGDTTYKYVALPGITPNLLQPNQPKIIIVNHVPAPAKE